VNAKRIRSRTIFIFGNLKIPRALRGLSIESRASALRAAAILCKAGIGRLRDFSLCEGPATLKMTLELLCSGQIRAFRGIDLNFLAFVDEGRHLHHESGLGLGGLGHAGCGSALQSGLGLDYG